MADAAVVNALEQMGFAQDDCVNAAIANNNNVQAASEWLLQHGNAAAPAGDDHGPLEGWRVVQGTIPMPLNRQESDPLSALSNADSLSFQDTGDGIVVMSAGAPVAFVAVYESSWYGRLFTGHRREATYELQDLERRPFARMQKPFSWLAQDSVVSQVSTQSGTSELGTIRHEFDLMRRKLFIQDSTPGHSAGVVRIEGFLTDPLFRIYLCDGILGQISHPKHGMGLAKLDFVPGALDAFRANRMRALMICATLLISDMYWGAAPNAFMLKAPLPFLR